MKIGVVGLGMVGSQVHKYFKGSKGYDKYKKTGTPEEIQRCELVFLCVPTPYEKDECNLSFLEDAFLTCTKTGQTVVIKSTVPPGACTAFAKRFPSLIILSNPEFLTEATAGQDFLHPERQIVGMSDPGQKKAAEQLLEILPKAEHSYIMSADEAAMVKYFGNAFFALKVAFANQMFDLCQKLKVDYAAVQNAVKDDSRIGPEHLTIQHKGYRGYGGKCLPKDTRALLRCGRSHDIDLTLLDEAERYNNALLKSQNLEN